MNALTLPYSITANPKFYETSGKHRGSQVESLGGGRPKAVQNITTGVTYPSIVVAAREVGAEPWAMSRSIRLGRVFAGSTWRFV